MGIGGDWRYDALSARYLKINPLFPKTPPNLFLKIANNFTILLFKP